MEITGSYNCVLQQEKGSVMLRRYGTLHLTSDGEKLRGTMFPTMFWLDCPFTDGIIRENHFCFEVRFSTPCQNFTMNVSGDIIGHKIIGQADTPMGTYILKGTKNTSADQAYFS